MAFSISAAGALTTIELREREITGYVSNTVDPDQFIDTEGFIDDTQTILNMLDAFGIHFTSTDGLISIYPDSSIEAHEFIEGSRIYLDSSAGLTVVSITEEM